MTLLHRFGLAGLLKAFPGIGLNRLQEPEASILGMGRHRHQRLFDQCFEQINIMIRALLVVAAVAVTTLGAAPEAGAAPTPSPSPTPPSSSLGPPYADCAAAIAAGKSNIPIGDPAYKSEWDHDGDGFACESSDDSE